MAVTCGAPWTSDPGRACTAAVWAGDRCVAHQADPAGAIAGMAASWGVLDLRRGEIDAATWAAIAAQLGHAPVGLALIADDATFLTEVSCDGSLPGRCSFAHATFTETVSFRKVTFPDGLDCRGTTFAGHTAFDGATFEFVDGVDGHSGLTGCAVSFDEAVFAGKAAFVDTRFETSVSFVATTFEAGADFGSATFECDWRHVRFDKATFRHFTTFIEAAWNRVSLEGGQPSFAEARFDSGVILVGAKLPRPDFARSVITGPLHLRDVRTFDDRLDLYGIATLGNLIVGAPSSTDAATPTLDAVPAENPDFADPGKRPSPGDASSPAAAAAAYADLTAAERAFGFRDLKSVVLRELTLTGPSTVFAEGDVALEHTRIDQPLTIYGELSGFRRCVVSAPVTFLGPVTSTHFAGSTGLEHVRFDYPRWRTRHDRPRGRPLIADEASPYYSGSGVPPDRSQKLASRREQELVYRQFRKGFEDAKAAPSATDFYIGELTARRRQTTLLHRDFWLLSAYRFFGGYGVRARPPFLWLMLVILGTSVAFNQFEDRLVRPVAASPTAVTVEQHPVSPPGPTTVTEQRTTPLGAPPSGHTIDGYDLDRYADSLAFVAKNSISLFSAPTAGLTAAGTLILILERFAAVTLLGLTVFALRSRVAR